MHIPGFTGAFAIYFCLSETDRILLAAKALEIRYRNKHRTKQKAKIFVIIN